MKKNTRRLLEISLAIVLIAIGIAAVALTFHITDAPEQQIGYDTYEKAGKRFTDPTDGR